MAKTKQPRNKSYNREADRRKTVTRAVKSILGSMFFIGDNRHTPVCFSESKLQMHLKGPDLLQGKRALHQLLTQAATTWSMLVVGFIKRGDQVDVVTGVRLTEEISGFDFFSNFTDYLHETLHEVLKANDTPPEELHSYSYFINMGDIYDFDKMEPNLIERMFRLGLGEDSNNLDVEELPGFEEFVKATSRVFMPKVKEIDHNEMILVSQEDLTNKTI